MFDTMSVMAPKKKKKPGPAADPNSKRSKGVNRYIHPRVVSHIPAEILALIEQDAAEGDRTRTAQMVRIFREYYRDKGRLSPSSEASGS